MNSRISTAADYILRFVFGTVFMFSGFVKAVDPMGTAYKIEEYLNVFGLDFLLNDKLTLPLILSVSLCVLEFTLGVLIFLHLYKKPTKILAALFMIFFTVTTLIDALTDNVKDCGCFGDAIKLSNWETFWKNIVLDVVLIGIFIFDKKTKEDYRKKLPCIVTSIILLAGISFAVRNTVFEPIIDFRPWKVGNKMAPTIDEQTPPLAFATYKNNSTGEEKEFSMSNDGENSLMKAYENDPDFASNWSYVEGKERIINTNTVAADGFSLVEIDDTKDVSLDILGDTEKDLYIVAVWNLKTANPKGMKRIKDYIDKLPSEKNNIIVMTASTPKDWYQFIEKYSMQDYNFYSCDDKAIKAMIRSNPGLLHLDKGVVKEKMSWRNL
ncbi:MAG: DoxX family protein [Bacteroidales bacterium]|nr:DoxX family protein [Bacteroidales bacterium]